MTTLICPTHEAQTEALRLLLQLDATVTVSRRSGDSWLVEVDTFDHAAVVAEELSDRWFVDLERLPNPGDDATDAERGVWLLERLRQFGYYCRPDPLDENYEEGCWEGSAADHADVLYQLLAAAGVKP